MRPGAPSAKWLMEGAEVFADRVTVSGNEPGVFAGAG